MGGPNNFKIHLLEAHYRLLFWELHSIIQKSKKIELKNNQAPQQADYNFRGSPGIAECWAWELLPCSLAQPTLPSRVTAISPFTNGLTCWVQWCI